MLENLRQTVKSLGNVVVVGPIIDNEQFPALPPIIACGWFLDVPYSTVVDSAAAAKMFPDHAASGALAPPSPA